MESNTEQHLKTDKGHCSAGFLLYSKGEFLLCHATKKKNDTPQKYDGCWSISKGLVEEGESPLETAVRELQEETSINLNSDNLRPLLETVSKPLLSFQVRNNKNVLLFFIDDPEGRLKEVGPLKCTSLINNGPDSPVAHLNGEPEMDAFMWVSRADAKKMVFKSQKFIFEPGYLEKKLKAVGKSLSSS